MEHSIYSYSLCISLTLMIFFALYFIFAQVPDKTAYANYLRSRRIMGVALLVLAANYCVHFFAQIRFSCPDLATAMNLSTYFLEAWLFSSALTSLLDREYLTRCRFCRHIASWALYTAISGLVIFVLEDGTLQSVAMLFMALCFFVYTVRLGRRLLIVYRRAVRAMDDYYSDDVAVYIRWMSRFTYWAVAYGVSCGLLTFLPEKYIYLWILSSVPFYTYLYVSYMNYLLFCHRVQDGLEEQLQVCPENETEDDPAVQDALPTSYNEQAAKLEQWILEAGFTVSGITVTDLAVMLDSNRTYLTGYIKLKYGVSFREWISSLRIEYAKKLLIEEAELSVAEIANRVGYQSSTHFIKLFSESEGISPAKWRKKRF